MSRRDHHTDYDEQTAARCERALVTLLGDLGPWRERIYLAGGLVPRYLVGQLPEGARAHVGTTDVDLVIGLALGDETPETYRTLQNNIEKAGVVRKDASFRWARDVEGAVGGRASSSARPTSTAPGKYSAATSIQRRLSRRSAGSSRFQV